MRVIRPIERLLGLLGNREHKQSSLCSRNRDQGGLTSASLEWGASYLFVALNLGSFSTESGARTGQKLCRVKDV